MILTIYENNEGKEITKLLKSKGIKTLSLLPTVVNAAVYGMDNVIVGSLDETRLRKVFKENDIQTVVDISGEETLATASFAIEICNELNIPYIRYERPSFDYSNYENVTFCERPERASEYINRSEGNVLIYGIPKNIKSIVGLIKDKDRVFTPVLKGGGVEPGFSLAYGLQLSSIIEVDGLESDIDIIETINKYNIKVIVFFENAVILNKISTLAKENVRVIITRSDTLHYPKIINTYDEILDMIGNWRKS